MRLLTALACALNVNAQSAHVDLSPSKAAGTLSKLGADHRWRQDLLWSWCRCTRCCFHRREYLCQLDVLRRKFHQLFLQTLHAC